MSSLWYDPFINRGLIPDRLLAMAIRILLRDRLASLECGNIQKNQEEKMAFAETLRESSIAIETDKANQQHYEVTTEFMQLSLGSRMKYSCCLFPTGKNDKIIRA